MSFGLLRARAVWLALAVALCAACSDARQPPQPASFDRPTDVDFVCVKERADASRFRDIAPLAECRFEASDRALHALVTQSARGEVAAVNLQTERILDNRRDIPGYTFVRTGELPIAIAVSRVHPELTYVASYGSRDVRVMRTRVLLGLTSEDAEEQLVPLTIGAGDSDGGTFGGTPSDMVLLPGEEALLVTLTDVGKVARLPLTASGEVDEEGITFIELPVTSPAPPVPVSIDEPYEKICGDYQRPPMPEVRAREALPAAAAPRPIALAVDCSRTQSDACEGGRVLISDEAQPVLHVLDLAALREGSDPLLAPIPTAVPTRDVVVTPPVPKAFVASGDDGGPTSFVYAIDAIDGSVMVLENDQVLAINRDPSGAVDRLPIDSRSGAPSSMALSLEVITPRFSTANTRSLWQDGFSFRNYASSYFTNANNVSPGDYCLDGTHTEVTPRRLRGVYLTAALADGTVRVVDVHDLGLRVCRDCDRKDETHASGANEPDAPILVRHHPRPVTDPISLNEGDRTELRPDTSAAVTVKTGQFSVRNNGSVASPLAPTLSCIPCGDGLEQALPDPKDQEAARAQASDGGVLEADDDDGGVDAGVDGVETICQQALVCGPVDPWIAPPTSYSVSYESSLPNTASGDGLFVPRGESGNITGLLELHSATSFCARGVLGEDDIGGARDADACLPVEREVPDPEDPKRKKKIWTLGSAELRGDQVVITSEVLSDAKLVQRKRTEGEREMCSLVRAKLEEDKTAVLGFEIIAAFEDRIAIREQMSFPFDGSDEVRLDLARLQTCIGDGLVRFYIRSQQGFLVQTGREGFKHNVIANANGRCVVDAMSGPRSSRRAWTGCQYDDGRIQFQLEPFERTAVVQEPGDGYGAIMTFGITTTAVPLVMNATQIGAGSSTLVPARLRYSTADEHLYLVDTYQGGLIPIDLDPFNDTPVTSFY